MDMEAKGRLAELVGFETKLIDGISGPIAQLVRAVDS